MPLKCKTCDCAMVWENPHSLTGFQESSSHIEGWPICKDCMIDHCVHANCLACNYGKYPDCQFLKMKLHCRDED